MSIDFLPATNELSALKTAHTEQPVHELIGKRWSPRAFSSREITEGQVISLLEAARWAPSSYNEQPWRFIVARKSDSGNYSKLLGSLMDLNRLWASSAPVLMLTLAKKTFTHNGSQNFYALHDAGIALGHLAIQATALGLSLHVMGGFDRTVARAAFEIPEDYELGAAVAIGYAGEPETLPERFQQAELAPRSRKPLADLVYAGLPTATR